MDIRVAYPAVEDLDENVMSAHFPPIKLKRRERRSFVNCGIGFCREHESPLEKFFGRSVA
jgi:hypothetical protein